MDIEEKIHRLEDQFLSTNARITELTDRLVRVEELLSKYVLARPSALGNEHECLRDHVHPEELYLRVSNLASDFNSMLPDLADVLALRAGCCKDDCANANVHLADLVKSKSGRRKESSHPNPFFVENLGSSHIESSVATNSQGVQIPNGGGLTSVPKNKPNGDGVLGTGAVSNGKRPGKEERKSRSLNSGESDSSLGKSKKLTDKQKNKIPNGADPLESSRVLSGSKPVLPQLKSSASTRKFQDQLPDVRHVDLLSKLVPNEVEGSNTHAGNYAFPVIRKSVAVFEENPWDDEMDKIPWEGTGSVDLETKRGHNSQGKADRLTGAKQKIAPCRKVCGNLTGHPCRVAHEKSLPCPPCTFLIKNFKLKCNHRIDVLCHRQGKINEYCSECDAKRLVKAEQEKPPLSRPALSLAMDPIQSESELAFKKVKEILNKLTSSNFDKLSEDFVAIVNAQTKFLPEIASVLIEKAMLDVENPLSPANYAKLASKTINRPEGELKMFRIEVVTLVINVFSAVLFPNDNGGAAASSTPYFIRTLLKRKEISELDPKRRNLGVLRFVGELFNQDVLPLPTMQTDVINPLIANPTEGNLDYLCKLLTLVGHKINEKVTGTASSSWFEDLFIKLNPFCDDSSISTQVRFSVQNLHDLKEVNWDRFKKPAVLNTTLKASLNIGSTHSLLSNGSSTAPPASGKPKRSKKKKQAPAVPNNENQPFPVPILPTPLHSSDIFDPWESAPWGEHTDPLAVAFPRLDSPSISGKETPIDPGWKGSQVSVSFAKAFSTSSSRVISPAISTCSLNSAHSSLPRRIDAVGIFNAYMGIHTSPQKQRVDLLSRKLAGSEEKQLRDFVRDLSRHILQLAKKSKVAAMGQLLDVLIKAQIVTEELVSKGFQSGIISDLPILEKNKPRNVFDEIIINAAVVVVTVWSERMSDFSWLVELARNIFKYPEVWNQFSTEVMAVVLDRKKEKFAKKCFESTKEGQDSLRKQAVALRLAHH